MTSFSVDAWLKKILNADDEGTVISKISTGKTARHVKNKLIDYWDKSGMSYLPMPLQGFLVWDLYASIGQSDQIEYIAPMAGQGVGMIKEIKSAEEVFNDMINGAVEVLTERLPQRVALK